MTEIAEEILTIDLGLPFALFGLECALGVSFDGAECERVFLDAANDQVSSKQYRFFSSSRLTVTGQVDDYEPEAIRLRVEGQRGCGEILRRVTQNSTFAVYRMPQSMEESAQSDPSITPPESPLENSERNDHCQERNCVWNRFNGNFPVTLIRTS